MRAGSLDVLSTQPRRGGASRTSSSPRPRTQVWAAGDRRRRRRAAVPEVGRARLQRAVRRRARPASAPWSSSPARWAGLARIAHGVSDDLIGRAADVMLKERRKLVLVARDTPLSLIHLENMAAVTRAGALVLPAMPSFYGRPQTIDELLDTVVGRVLDHLGLPLALGPRWGRRRRRDVDERQPHRSRRLRDRCWRRLEAPASFVALAAARRPTSTESDDVDEWMTLDVERRAAAGRGGRARGAALAGADAARRPAPAGLSLEAVVRGTSAAELDDALARSARRCARRVAARGARLRRHRHRRLSRGGGDAAQPRHARARFACAGTACSTSRARRWRSPSAPTRSPARWRRAPQRLKLAQVGGPPEDVRAAQPGLRRVADSRRRTACRKEAS